MVNYSVLAGELLESLCTSADAKHRRNTEDFTHGEVRILTCLMRHGGSSTPGDICEQLDMTGPRVSAAVNSLTKKGLVVRETDVQDKRRCHVYITDAGKELVRKKKKELTDSLEKVLELLGENDAREYVRIVGRICENAAE